MLPINFCGRHKAAGSLAPVPLFSPKQPKKPHTRILWLKMMTRCVLRGTHTGEQTCASCLYTQIHTFKCTHTYILLHSSPAFFLPFFSRPPRPILSSGFLSPFLFSPILFPLLKWCPIFSPHDFYSFSSPFLLPSPLLFFPPFQVYRGTNHVVSANTWTAEHK